MRESLYIGNNTMIINLTSEFYQSAEEIVSSKGFRDFLTRYFHDLAVRDIKVFRWITGSREMEEMIPSMIILAKQLLVLDVEEIGSPLLNRLTIMKALFIVEDAYNYWRSKPRFSVISPNGGYLSFSTFMDADSRFNQLVLQLYRTLEERLQGRSNKVYRQLNAGTNGSCVIRNYKWQVCPGYNSLRNIPFVSTVMLRTPIIFHPTCNKREGTFVELEHNPIKNFRFNPNDWLCMPLKVNDLLCFTYFHKDYMANGMSLSNLFEIADDSQITDRKPDLVCLFGNQDDKEQCGFYYDKINDVWVATVSFFWKAEYFGYIKKAILTIHNLAKMQKGILPVHGSMVRILFRNGTTKSMVLIGDSGAGKSETVEALKGLSNEKLSQNTIRRVETIFDDMGSLKIVDGKVVANGTETGAFIRLDDLDKSSSYQDIERSIFINPESNNARVILPVTNYEVITADQPVDMVLYANNYQDKIGVERFEDYQQGRQVFIDGKRIAKKTTQEEGLSSTYFANPFGPMQKQQQCQQIMDDVFAKLYEKNVYVGQIYTNLATEHPENIRASAQQLLSILKKL